MRASIVFAVLLSLAGCVTHRRRPEPSALEAKAELPPHVVEVAYGLFSCERGFLIRQGRCIPFEEIPHGPVVEISELPSAGEGAPTTCPSGGCGYLVSPSYSFVYSGAGLYDYGYGWPGLYSSSGICGPRVRRFRGGELAFGRRSFIQERRFAASGFFGAPLRVHSSAQRRIAGGSFFGGSSRRVAHQRSGRGGTWR